MNYWKVYFNHISDKKELKSNLKLGKDYLNDDFFGFIFHDDLVQICGGKLGNGKLHFPFKNAFFTPEYVLNKLSDIEFENTMPEDVVFINEEEILNIIYSKEVSSGQSYLNE